MKVVKMATDRIVFEFEEKSSVATVLNYQLERLKTATCEALGILQEQT